MLRFEALELIGFKSFADKTRVVFDDKITSIIGPNGCGKSNLFDALGWVLGTSNARNLRGEKMEDAIFNGTGKRKPSGIAQATLTLRAPEETVIHINGREVVGESFEVSRRVDRSGKSLFLINQKRCRLKDVHQALEDMGLGYASYALIAQGKIESFLTGKPLDRRAIIEEAAQITNYKSRRRSAEVKLELAQQNLLRINDIISEVERSLRSLKRQASKARRYTQLKQEFKDVQLLKFGLQARAIQSELKDVRAQISSHQKNRKDLTSQITEAEETFRKGNRKRDVLEEELTELQQAHSKTVREIDRCSDTIRFNQEQIQSTRRLHQSAQAEQEIIRQSLQETSAELEGFRQERSSLDDEKARIEAALTEQQRLLDECGTDRRSVENRLDSLRASLIELSAESASLSNLKEQLTHRLKSVSGNRERLLKDRASHALALEESERLLQQRIDKIVSEGKRFSDLQAELSETRETLEIWESEASELTQQRMELNNGLIATRERLQSLQEVEINHSQYSEGVQKLLNHLKNESNFRSGGTLADQIETDPQYEHLMEEFLEDELEYVLVDSMDEAILGLSEVKALAGGRCTFMSIRSNNGFGTNGNGNIDPPADRGALGTVGKLLQMKPAIEKAFRRVLPQRADAIVVSELSQAFDLAHSYPESTFVTMQGETLAPRGLLASTAVPSAKLGLLSIKRQKNELEKKTESLQKQLREVEGRLIQHTQKISTLKEALQAQQNSIYDLEKEILGLKHQKMLAQSEFDRSQRAVRVVDDELSQLDSEESQLKQRLKDTEEQRRNSSSQQAETEASLTQKSKEFDQLQQEQDRLQEQLHLVSSDRKVLEERHSSLHRTLERIQNQHDSLEGRLENTSQSEAESLQTIQRLSNEVETLGERLSEFEVLEQKEAGQLGLCQKRVEQWRQEFPDVEARLAKLREQMSNEQEAAAELGVAQARLDTQLHSISIQAKEQLQVPLESAIQDLDLDSASLGEVCDNYEILRRRLEGFGPINMTALEEFQGNEERHEFLTKQRQDLETSIADTTRAIQKLNRLSREKFQEAFDAVNQNFKEMFRKLFGGGDCGMQLLDEEDLLESGLDIYARPPGKKLQNVMLLSGGEKALTVLALLVGLFAFRPSRFCVLDEVDAPLDDANVSRFTNLLREMSQKTQLILVTHNKLTMESSDSIFGVTMEEPGVSQVVSVRF
jgi:chromosome segregation protein